MLAFSACSSQTKTTEDKLNIIFETDVGNDVDDALALDMLYKYAEQGRIRLLGISINKEGVAPIEFADILNTWYGQKDVPIARVHDGIDCESDAVNYAKAVCALKDASGAPLFERSLSDYDSLPESVAWYRKTLASEPDGSVTIVSVGFSTNIIRLLDSEPDSNSPLSGRDLVAQKVKSLVMMAGCFNDPNLHEYNVVKDIPAAQSIFSSWPTPIVTLPFEVGIAINYPASSIEGDFGWAPAHHIVEAYKAYLPMPYDRPTWDLDALLYAVEGGDMFTLSPLGDIEVDDKGTTTFTENPSSTRRYLSTSEEQNGAILKHLVEMISSAPLKYRK